MVTNSKTDRDTLTFHISIPCVLIKLFFLQRTEVWAFKLIILGFAPVVRLLRDFHSSYFQELSALFNCTLLYLQFKLTPVLV